MPDREKVIKGLECHKRAMYGEVDEHGLACNTCPYRDMESTCRSTTEGQLIEDVLTLLKEQEPVKPYLNSWFKWSCGNSCGTDLFGFEKYCPYCGKPVKWE